MVITMMMRVIVTKDMIGILVIMMMMIIYGIYVQFINR